MPAIAQVEIENWVKNYMGIFTLDDVLKDLHLQPDNRGHLRTIMSRLADKKVIKLSGKKDGSYRIIKDVKPVDWLNANEAEYANLYFPVDHSTGEGFGFAQLLKLSPGDLIIIAGVSNAGKSCLALNILAENINQYQCLLMGNEYTTLDGIPSPRFKRRMLAMDWVNWTEGQEQSKFVLLPIRENFEDYIESGKLNIVDWIRLGDNFYEIATILENIKVRLGKGLAVVVLQKSSLASLAIGGQFTEHLADFYFSIDPLGKNSSRLTVGKAKDASSRVSGRMWRFDIWKGARISNIKEIRKCSNCYGKGYRQFTGTCQQCSGTGYVDIEGSEVIEVVPEAAAEAILGEEKPF